MTNKKKKLIICMSVAIAIIAAVTIFMRSNKRQPITIIYETAKVERATISNSVTATGTIEPVNKVEVGTQVSGIISKIYVDYNSIVKKGQVIAELDKINLESELASAKANLASSKSELDYQETNYKRMKALHDKGFISDDDFDIADLSYKKAKEAYLVQLQTVQKAQTNLGYATITSPIDGVVLSKDVEEGQTVAASFSTPTLFTIARDLTDMQVVANVDEADIGNVRDGQRVTFTVDAFPDDTFEGRVKQVRQQGEEESNVVTYEVVISAPNNDLKLKPQLTANVNIYTEEIENVVSVPAKALRFSPSKEMMNDGEKIKDCNATNKLWIKEANILKAYPVKTGITNGIRTQILEGVKEGTAVITNAKAKGGTEEDNISEQNSQERSPFSPGPPERDKKQKK
jgi:HlyD family secretion protein